MTKLTGEVYEWQLNGHVRKYGVSTLPYRRFVTIARTNLFDATTGKGEQREQVKPHVSKLRNAMLLGEYTPTSVAVGTYEHHRHNLTVQAGQFALTLEDGDYLPLTDGGHRISSLKSILEDLTRQYHSDEVIDKGRISEAMEEVESLPITFILALDGDTQKDFANLQEGRRVNASHLFSLRVMKHMMDPAMQKAFELAQLLDTKKGSPFEGLIRFDSTGMKPLPISTLCARGASDLATSLVGMAKIVEKFSLKPAFATDILVQSFKALEKEAPDLLERGRILTPIKNSGGKGSSTMLVGIGVVMAYRMGGLGHKKVSPSDLEAMVETARSTLDHTVEGSFSSQEKRTYVKNFAQLLLEDIDEPMHDRLPVGLLETLSTSAFRVSPIDE